MFMIYLEVEMQTVYCVIWMISQYQVLDVALKYNHTLDCHATFRLALNLSSTNPDVYINFIRQNQIQSQPDTE